MVSVWHSLRCNPQICFVPQRVPHLKDSQALDFAQGSVQHLHLIQRNRLLARPVAADPLQGCGKQPAIPKKDAVFQFESLIKSKVLNAV